MYGNSTGLVPADSSSAVDAATSGVPIVRTPTAEEIANVHEWLVSRADWQAARGLIDAWERAKSAAGQG